MCLQILGPSILLYILGPRQPCPGPAPTPRARSTNPGTRVFLQAQPMGAGHERFHKCIRYEERRGSARLSCTATAAAAPATSSRLGNRGHMLILMHVNHLKRLMFHSWHPWLRLGSPGASCRAGDSPDKGAVMNLSETTVFCTQQNTVNELFITMLLSSSTTTEPDTQGFN